MPDLTRAIVGAQKNRPPTLINWAWRGLGPILTVVLFGRGLWSELVRAHVNPLGKIRKFVFCLYYFLQIKLASEFQLWCASFHFPYHSPHKLEK